MQHIDYGLDVLRTDVLANWPQNKHSTWLAFYRSFFKEHPSQQHESHLMPKVGISDCEAFAMLEVECGKVNDQR